LNKLNKIVDNYPNELKLLLACCGSEKWSFNELLPTINFDLFMQLLKRHRLIPTLYKFISANPNILPNDINKKINLLQQRITKRSLSQLSELIKIRNHFDKLNIAWFTLKGPILAQQLYGNIAYRDYRDIDIFIEEEKLLFTLDVLLKHDYDTKNKLLAKDLVKVNHNIELINTKTKNKIELHWKLFANEYLFSFEDVNKIKENYLFDNNAIPTVNIPSHYGYIFIHSALHQWNEIQWLLDCKEITNNHELKNNVYKLLDFNKLSLIPSIFESINSLLFNKKDILIDSNKGMVEHCLKAINSNKTNFFSKLNKSVYLYNLSESKQYRNNLYKLRIKRIIKNPSTKK